MSSTCQDSTIRSSTTRCTSIQANDEVVAGFDVALADYGIRPPTEFFVLSVADHGRVELHLLFRLG